MQLISELLAKGKKCPEKGALLTPKYFLFRRQIH